MGPAAQQFVMHHHPAPAPATAPAAAPPAVLLSGPSTNFVLAPADPPAPPPPASTPAPAPTILAGPRAALVFPPRPAATHAPAVSAAAAQPTLFVERACAPNNVRLEPTTTLLPRSRSVTPFVSAAPFALVVARGQATVSEDNTAATFSSAGGRVETVDTMGSLATGVMLAFKEPTVPAGASCTVALEGTTHCHAVECTFTATEVRVTIKVASGVATTVPTTPGEPPYVPTAGRQWIVLTDGSNAIVTAAGKPMATHPLSSDTFLLSISGSNISSGSAITVAGIDLEPTAHTGGVGPAGPRGATGPSGGPTGPRGERGANALTFSSTWVSDARYNAYDFVAYDGSTYLCTVEVQVSDTPPPSDPVHWALIAAAGAQGPTGTSTQGNTGPAPFATLAAWSPTGNYTPIAPASLVNYYGSTYVSVATGNTAPTPGANNTQWGLLAAGLSPLPVVTASSNTSGVELTTANAGQAVVISGDGGGVNLPVSATPDGSVFVVVNNTIGTLQVNGVPINGAPVVVFNMLSIRGVILMALHAAPGGYVALMS